MALTKLRKTELLGEFEKIVGGANSIVFVHAKGLSVADTTTLRNALASANAGYRVVKKTLLKIALANAKFAGTMPELDGEIAVAYSDDATAPAREVWNFAKKFEDKIAMAGGVFEGAFLDKVGIMAIATIPPTPILRGMFLNVINSPIQGLAIALSQIAEKKVA